MPYKFVNSSLDTRAHTINMESTTGFYYENGNGKDSEYTAATTALGTSYRTTYCNPHIGTNGYYAVKGSNNAITWLSFVYELYRGQQTWCIYRMGFRNEFKGKVHFKIVSFSGGAGTSGATSTILDADGQAEVTWTDGAFMDSGHIPAHSLYIGSYTSSRYAITITATSTQGEVISLHFPLVFLSTTTQNGRPGGIWTIWSTVTGTGYSSTNILTSNLKSEFTPPSEFYTTPTTLNLENKTFKYAVYE